MPPEFSQETVEAWVKELALLQDERAAEYAEFKPLRDEQQKMSHITLMSLMKNVSSTEA